MFTNGHLFFCTYKLGIWQLFTQLPNMSMAKKKLNDSVIKQSNISNLR